MTSAAPYHSMRFVTWLRRDIAHSNLPAKSQKTVASIKLATAMLLEKRGYDDMSMLDIAQAAQISRPALYQYFKSKQVLVMELLEDFYTLMNQVLFDARQPTSGDEGIRAVNRAYVRFFAANARVMLSIHQVRHSLKGAARLNFDINERWAQRIAQQITRHILPEEQVLDPLLCAYALEHMVDGLLADIFIYKNPLLKQYLKREDHLADTLTALWLLAIRSRAA